MEKQGLNSLELDTLGEISNICLGISATTLNVLLHNDVNITTPSISVHSKEEIERLFKKERVAVRCNYVEGLVRSDLLLLRVNDAKKIADLMMGGDGNGMFAEGELSDLHLSAVAEAMNQMMGSSATALSNMLGTVTDISTPETKITTASEMILKTFPDEEVFVSIEFKMVVGNVLHFKAVQVYPFAVAKQISTLFLEKERLICGNESAEV